MFRSERPVVGAKNLVASLSRTDVEQALKDRDFAGVRRSFAEQYPADVAELIQSLDEEERALLFRLLPREQAAQAFSAGGFR